MDPNSYTNNPEDFQFDYDYPIDLSQLMGDGDDPLNENFPSNQTVGRISNQQEVGELGSLSCGSNLQALNQNLTEVIPGSCTPEMEGTPFLEPIQEDAPFVVQPDSSSFGSPIMEIPQRTFSTVQEHLEAGNDDQALEEWLNNNNPDTTGIASITSSDTLVANPATNAPLDMGTPSVGAPSVTEATQPYVRAPELLGDFGNHVQVSNSSVHLEPVVFPGTESQQSHRSISGQEPALTTNGGNIEQTMSTFAIPLLSPTHGYPQTSVGMAQVPQTGVVQLFQDDNNWTTNTPIMPSSPSQIPFQQNDFVSPHVNRTSVFSEGSNLFVNQLGQNMAISDSLMRNKNTQQAGQFPTTSFLQPTGSENSRAAIIGRSSSSLSGISSQPANRVPQMSSTSSALSSLLLHSTRTQQCRILPATGVGRGAQHSNSLLLPETSVPERSRSLLTALLADSRTQGIRSAYTPRSRFSFTPTTQSWTQQFINHDYQPSVLANSWSRQSQNTILPVPSLSQWPEVQLPVSNGIIDFQSYSPSSAISSATTRAGQQSCYRQLLSQLLGTQILPSSQRASSSVFDPSPVYGSFEHLEQLFNPTTNLNNPHQGSSFQLGSSWMTGGRNYRRGRQQAQTTSGMTSMLNHPRMEGLFASSTEPQQGNFSILNFEAPTRNIAQRTTIEGTAGRSSRDRMPSDHTSAAPPPPLRRPKRAAATQAMTSNDIPTTEGVITIDEDHQSFIPNAMYDPLFEGVGLAVDPHLRMFSFN